MGRFGPVTQKINVLGLLSYVDGPEGKISAPRAVGRPRQGTGTDKAVTQIALGHRFLANADSGHLLFVHLDPQHSRLERHLHLKAFGCHQNLFRFFGQTYDN